MFDGVEELDALAPLDVFASARRLGADVDPVLVTTGRPRTMVARHGTPVGVMGLWSPDDDSVVVVPGGGYSIDHARWRL